LRPLVAPRGIGALKPISAATTREQGDQPTH
jgi:hypothetical protein